MGKRVSVKRPGILQALKSDRGGERESQRVQRTMLCSMFGILLDFRCQRETKELEEEGGGK